MHLLATALAPLQTLAAQQEQRISEIRVETNQSDFRWPHRAWLLRNSNSKLQPDMNSILRRRFLFLKWSYSRNSRCSGRRLYTFYQNCPSHKPPDFRAASIRVPLTDSSYSQSSSSRNYLRLFFTVRRQPKLTKKIGRLTDGAKLSGGSFGRRLVPWVPRGIMQFFLMLWMRGKVVFERFPLVGRRMRRVSAMEVEGNNCLLRVFFVQRPAAMIDLLWFVVGHALSTFPIGIIHSYLFIGFEHLSDEKLTKLQFILSFQTKGQFISSTRFHNQYQPVLQLNNHLTSVIASQITSLHQCSSERDEFQRVVSPLSSSAAIQQTIKSKLQKEDSETAVQKTTGTTHCSETCATVPGSVISLMIARLPVAVLVIAGLVGVIVVVASSTQPPMRCVWVPVSASVVVIGSINFLCLIHRLLLLGGWIWRFNKEGRLYE